LHVDRDGTLTIYPIGIDKVERRWDLRPDGQAHEPWFVPRDTPPAAHLIEPPIRLGARR
jgi:hypothetical protein